jgi:CBS domain-containing protein
MLRVWLNWEAPAVSKPARGSRLHHFLLTQALPGALSEYALSRRQLAHVGLTQGAASPERACPIVLRRSESKHVLVPSSAVGTRIPVGHAFCSATDVRTDLSYARHSQLRAVVCPVCEEWAVADVGGSDTESRAWMEEPVANAMERIVAISMNPAPELLQAVLLSEQCGAVAIVDREHRPVDVVTRYDVLESIVTSRRDSLASPRCTLLLESTPTELALRRLLETDDSQHLIVVDEGGRFVGLVTPRSLLARARAWSVTGH